MAWPALERPVSDGTGPGPESRAMPEVSSAPLPRPGGTSRKMGFTVVIAVAAVLLLVLSLVFLGSSGSSGGGSTPVPFSSARNAVPQPSPPGDWQLVAAAGLNLANATTLETNLSAVQNCTVTPIVGRLPSSITIPSFQGNLSTGESPEWVFDYVQPSTGAELEAIVTGGAADFVYELSGSGCTSTDAASIHGISNDIVDSPAAASAVSAAGGEAFLRAHPTGVSEEMVIINPSFSGLGAVSPEWLFLYSTCPLPLNGSISSPSGYTFDAAVNATTGVVIPESPVNGTCGGTPSMMETIGSALQLGAATLIQGPGSGGTIASQGCASGDYCYEVPIKAASENVTPGDFELEVTNATGSEVPVAGYAITNTVGQVVVYSLGSIETAWSSGVGTSTTLLASTMTLSLDLGTTNPSALGSLALSITGVGPFVESGEGISL